ncbi:nitroimidazol reductase NimA-like FMN-containing flavoprotein (pyridoxamine 5'-phosphate oxidase superfamily) [Natronospira proteinivora]|uniref:Nitroimidazol reductase NimA-like FMN-containing flavoprotein (Pyridoxamine 5'-phosphate oxidase superfamily) n=1 Tax=Natronospira proteinivora TaxID=1807133 RepID=A0ABT1G8B8_9GAMM|nr:pyridoxamine 5'-phosphate oxidase family protein [Natronospira proteinivora]MCP1727573.1 nitroimidazol reductase NimA-like FMN-containing flavoprotein (pyridoxamine 5'-phosphate oxidase superfamily) [Natronospira proteinivora]
MTEGHIVQRKRNRGKYDFEAVRGVLDDGIVCHVGFVQDKAPVVIPMLYAREGRDLLLHGSVASRLLRELSTGISVCVTVTHLDGLVLAASVFDHSANYRSAVIFGQARTIEDPAEKARAFDHLVDFMIPGRSQEARPANRKEAAATTVLRLPIETFSVKQRSGPAGSPEPGDPKDVWTGVIPISTQCGPVRAEQNPGKIPYYISSYRLNASRLKEGGQYKASRDGMES